jgi:hypothetical protein
MVLWWSSHGVMISKCSCLAQLRWGTIHGVYYKLVQMDPCSLFGLIIHAVPMGAWSTPWKEASTGVLHEVPHVEPNRVPHEVPPTISRLYSRVSGFVEMCDRPMSISQGAGWDHGLANDTRMGQGLQVPPDRHEEHLQDESGADGWQWHACANCRGSGHHRCLVYQAQADLRGGGVPRLLWQVHEESADTHHDHVHRGQDKSKHDHNTTSECTSRGQIIHEL